MLPLYDDLRTNRFPIVTYGLIGLNALIFFYMVTLSGQGLLEFIQQYGAVAAEITMGVNYLTLLTSLFLHGGIAHIVGNMLFLNIFGDNIEDRLGSLRYILFYLVCGLVASLTQIMVNPDSSIPLIGASGAVAGLMGAYLRLYPHTRILTLFTFGYFVRMIHLPAWTMLIYWVLFEIISGVGSLGYADQGGVAYFAHIGGFVTGWILSYLFASE